MHAPILILRHALVTLADAHEAAVALSFADYADEAMQVEMLILATQANASDLHRQIVFRDRRHVPLAVHVVLWSVPVFPLPDESATVVPAPSPNRVLLGTE